MNPVRACVVAVLSLLVPFSLASAPCEFRRNVDVRTRAIAYDVAADFNDVWIATGHGVALWLRSGETLTSGPSIAVPGTTVALAAVSGGVWAGSGRALYFVERGPTLRITSSIQLDAEVNDLVAVGSWLYAATSSGIIQVDALDRPRPVVVTRLNTTSGSALSVAVLGQHLYAADGDRTVEVYAIGTPTLPQKAGTFDSLPRSLAVQADGASLFVSDGQQTEVFAGSGTTMTRLASFRFGATAVAAGPGSVRFVAGADRTVRAINVLAPVPTVHAMSSTALTSGTVNRITALATAGNLLLASAGDAGLAAWSLSSFAPPFPAASFEIGTVASAWIADQRAVVALPAGGLRRYTESSGVMSPGPSWENLRVWKIHDGDGTAVLAGSGALLQLWDSSAATPASISSVNLAGAVISAAMTAPRKAVVILADHTAWSVDLSAAAGAATKLAVAGAPAFVAASAAGVAFGEISASGNTVIRYYRGGEITAPVEATVEGTSNGGIAVSSSGVAAAATFRGIALVDMNAGTPPRYVEGTSGTPVRDLEIEGDRLLVLGSERLDGRRITDGARVRSWDLTAEASQVLASGDRAAVATENGFAVFDLTPLEKVPVKLALTQDAPRFFRSIHRDGPLLWLVESSRAEAFTVDGLGLPHPASSLEYDETIVASAAAGELLYTLTASGKLAARDRTGVVHAQLAIAEGADQQMNALHAVGGAVWVSLTRGCSSGGCEKKTLVVTPAPALTVSASLAGGIVDVQWSGDRAWALSEAPREVRVYDLASPSAPVLVSSQAAAGDPVSVAHVGGSVWTLGSTLRRWSETLQAQGEFLDPWTADPSGRVTYIDQKVRDAEGCLLVVGRAVSTGLFDVSSGSPVSVHAPPSAGAVRGAAIGGGFVHLLGETFMEGWTTAPKPERGRPVRR